MIKAGIIGATGYAGGELVRILTGHREAEIVWYGSRSYIDQKYADVYRNMFEIVDAKCLDDNMEELAKQADVIFTATPQGYCASVISEEILERTKIVDLSAGRGAKVPNLFCEVNENMKAYGVASHRHTPEIEEQLSYASGEEVPLSFTPHLVPMNRGILATEYASLKGNVTEEDVRAVYEKYYKEETFIRVLRAGACPETKWVEGSNYVDIGFQIDPRTNRIVMMGAIDNLVKGAAGQAVQNMNIMFGLPEDEGLKLVPLFP